MTEEKPRTDGIPLAVVAGMLGISRANAYRMSAKPKIATYKFSGMVMVPPEEVERLKKLKGKP